MMQNGLQSQRSRVPGYPGYPGTTGTRVPGYPGTQVQDASKFNITFTNKGYKYDFVRNLCDRVRQLFLVPAVVSLPKAAYTYPGTRESGYSVGIPSFVATQYWEYCPPHAPNWVPGHPDTKARAGPFALCLGTRVPGYPGTTRNKRSGGKAKNKNRTGSGRFYSEAGTGTPGAHISTIYKVKFVPCLAASTDKTGQQ
eukprot:3385929-Rhodomonas_salina.1